MSIAMSAAQQQPPQHSERPASPAFHVGPNGRLRQQGVSDSDRNTSLALHLSPLIGFIIFAPLALVAPLVLWLVRKDQAAFVDDHGREVMNFAISFFLLHLILGVTVVGIILYPVLWIVGLVNVIRGSVAASNSELFRYPLTIRLLS